MRARTRWRTRTPNDHLPVLLDVLGWMPHDKQDSDNVQAHKERILQTLPEPAQSSVRQHHVLTVYRARTDTCGVVSREQPDILTFRIESTDPANVHKAAEDLCESLAIEYGKHWRIRDHAFRLVGNLEILEKHGETPIHDGTFVRGRLRRALRERGLEALTALFLLALAALCFWASRPTHLFDASTLEGQHLRWALDIWGRLGTAFVASAVTAVIYVLFTLLSVSRHRFVVWNPPRNK